MAQTPIESRVNILLIVAVLCTLGPLLTAAYKGWREEHGWHSGHEGTRSAVIADITVNLGGMPKQEPCQMCHPEARPLDWSTIRDVHRLYSTYMDLHLITLKEENGALDPLRL